MLFFSVVMVAPQLASLPPKLFPSLMFRVNPRSTEQKENNSSKQRRTKEDTTAILLSQWQMENRD